MRLCITLSVAGRVTRAHPNAVIRLSAPDVSGDSLRQRRYEFTYTNQRQ